MSHLLHEALCGLVLDRELRLLVQAPPGALSSSSLLQGQVCRDDGDRMAVTGQMQFESAVTERYQDAFVGSSIAEGATIITCDLRQHGLHPDVGTTSTLSWRKEACHVAIPALSTFHNPMTYRFLFAQGHDRDSQHQRLYFTPDLKGVSTAPQMRHSIIRLACSLAVVCGVSLRHLAVIFSALFLLPLPTSSLKRGMDDIGTNVPSQEEMLQQWLASTPATACHIDGDYPVGTDPCVMVVRDAHARILRTPEAASEKGDDARQFLQR